MKKFIRVFNDEDTSRLLELGYELISEDDESATFLNDKKLKFSSSDVKHVVYTDKLFFKN